MKVVSEQNLSESESLTLNIGNDVSLSFCWIPPGSFLMGSPDAEAGHEESEAPLHRVIIAQGFHLSRTPITCVQWQALVGESRSTSSSGTHPMTEVSWDDAQLFAAKFSTQFPDWALRLPTESEWEYACRAGSPGCYSNGESEADLERIGWYAGNSDGKTHPVSEKTPNAWDLYDMHGNVFEWCQDWDGAYLSGEQRNPAGPSSGDKRILRGGCFKCPPQYCRSANRYSAFPDRRGHNFGFRLVLPL